MCTRSCSCCPELTAVASGPACTVMITYGLRYCDRFEAFKHWLSFILIVTSALSSIMRMDDNADAKRILLASPSADWRRQLGRPRITWLSTVQ